MANYREFSKNQNYLNLKSMNGLLFLQLCTMVLIFSPYNSAQEMEPSNTSCKEELTCTKCTNIAQCEWFLDQQTCVRKTSLRNSSLIIHSKDKCPQFSVRTIHEYGNEFIYLLYIVKVSNDSIGFMKFLDKTNFTCNSTTIDIYKSEIINNEIQCSTQINISYFKQNSKQSLTTFIYVKFNGVILRLENIADHYATIYEKKCAEENKDKYCATCTWNDEGFSHYVRLCSTNNSCEGHNELYMRHNSIGQFWNLTSQKVNDRCAEINVTAINPLSVSQAGGSNITITVKNHGIFEDRRKVLVTVAGEVCANPTTTGNDSITCITSPPPNDTYVGPPSGPVSVTYISDKGRLNIESSQTFQFYVGTTCGAPSPVLGLRQELYGIESGGTNVTLNGFRFIQPCVAFPARMFVKLANGTMQFASKYCDTPVNDTLMVCRAPEMNITNGWDVNAPNFTRALNFGLEVMDFVGNKSLLVNGPLISYYHVLENYVLDEFEIVGDNSVAIYGKHLRNIHHDVLIRFNDLPANDCKLISATESSFVCMTNTPIIVSAVMNVTVGGVLTYKLTKRPCNLSKLIWFFIVIFLSVVVVVCSYCYRIRSRHGVNKTGNGPLGNLKDLDTRTVLLQC